MDTVFDPGTAAERPFRIEDGVAYGPGVTDMKSGLLAGLYALKALVGELGGVPFERLTFIANPDEEIGSPSSTAHIRAAAPDADACFVLECARANGDIVSARKGASPGHADHDRRPRGTCRRGAGEGAERDPGGKSHRPRAACAEWPLAGRDRQRRRHRRWDAAQRRGGRCHLEVDVRSVTSDGLDIVEAAVREIATASEVPDTIADVHVMVGWRPMEKLARSGRLVEHAQAVAGRLGFEAHDTSTGGASDANTTAGMGVPTLDGLGPIGGNDHAPGEYLDVDSIVPRTTLLAGLLLAVARDPQVLAWRDGPG